MPDLNSGRDIGAALKAVREFRGLSLESVAATTFIRRAHLDAIEQMQLDKLPSRPFTVGYIRAYATALGLSGDAAVARFKHEEPAFDDGLRGPVGVEIRRDPRLAAVMIGGVLLVAAILMWNIAQRAMNEEAPPPPTAPDRPAAELTRPSGPLSLGAPLPTPVESTTPVPYKTPGLEAATAGGGSADAAETARKLAAANPTLAEPDPANPLPATFTANGQVYGAEANASNVILQARKPASLIVRGGDDAVYFARQLAAGEAYRAPMLKGLTVDASEPNAFQVFVDNQSKGLLPTAKTPVGKLLNPAAKTTN